MTLDSGDERDTRTLTRRNGTIAFSGDLSLDDPTIADSPVTALLPEDAAALSDDHAYPEGIN